MVEQFPKENKVPSSTSYYFETVKMVKEEFFVETNLGLLNPHYRLTFGSLEVLFETQHRLERKQSSQFLVRTRH